MKIFFLLVFCFSIEASIDKYFIAIKKNEKGVRGSLDLFTSFFPPQDKFYADPMLLSYKGQNYLFFEEYDYKKGVISCIHLETGDQPKIVLNLPIHISFPHVFKEEEEVYMTPETYDYKRICLFKANPFPDRWEFVRTLVEGRNFSDPILFKHDGYYWIFASVRKEELVIYYAKDLSDTFLPHPVNSLRKKGRNAGAVFYEEGKLIRPVMNCIEGYGKSVLLKQILKLTTKEFIEKKIEEIKPNWAPHLDGTHSYSQNEEYVVYDGRLKERP